MSIDTLPEVIDEKYRVLGEIGRGGMGRVLRVEHLHTGQILAMKVLLNQPHLDSEAVQRFRRETRASARLRSRHVVRITDAGVATELGGAAFLVMELLDGVDLQRHAAQSAPLPHDEVVAILGQVAKALDEVHTAGLVHRDLKPGNIFLHREDGGVVVKLLDFGLVKQSAGEDTTASGLTADGAVLGTPSFMSPEQVLGKTERVDARTDLWAVGMVAFRLLTGRTYWPTANFTRVLVEIARGPTTPPSSMVPELPATFDEWFARSCHRIPSQRWPDAMTQYHELAKALGVDAPEEPRPVLSWDMPAPPTADELATGPTIDTGAQTVAEPSAQRRQVTVLFYRVTPANKRAREMDPERYEALEGRFRDALEEALGDLGQTGRRSAQGGRFVFFGYPRAYGDDARRAVEAGMRILETARHLAARQASDNEPAFGVRVAAHTGVVIARPSVDPAGPLVGPALGAAADLAHHAQLGEFVVSGTTWSLVEHRFSGEPVDSDGAVRVLATREESGETPSPGRMVGRRVEVALLEEALDDARHGQPRSVLITGEAGIGKSRLVQALLSAACGSEVLCAAATCSPYFQRSAFQPLVPVVRTLVGADPVDDGLAGLLGRELSDPEGFHALSPQLRRERTLGALLSLLRDQVTDNPFIFVVEDLHWADPSTLELLDRLVAADDAAILTVLTARPDFEFEWTAPRSVTPLELRRLSPKHTSQVVRQLASGADLGDAIVEELVRRTDGVPLFIEELTRLVVDRAQDTLTDGATVIGEAPSTLGESLAARLDALGETRQLAEVCSVLGSSFSAADIAAVWGAESKAMTVGLERLLRADLMVRRGVGDDERFAFRHALVRDAAYASLPRETRRGLHARFGGALAQRQPPSPPELVAHHFAEAGMAREAAGLLFAAGQRALERSANQEALAHFDKGLEQLALLDQTPGDAVLEITFWVMKGMTWVVSRGYAVPEVQEAFSEAKKRVKELGEIDAPELLPALWGEWVFSLVRGDFISADETARRLLRLAAGSPAPGIRMLAHLAAGTTCNGNGRPHDAIRHLDLGIGLYDPEAHAQYRLMYGQDPLMFALVFRAWSQWMVGDVDSAKASVDAAVAHAETLNHPNSLGFALALSAIVHHDRGDLDEVVDRSNALLALSTEQGWIQWLGHAKLWFGAVEAARGNYDEGIASMLEGRGFAEFAGEKSGESHYESVLIQALVDAGRLDEAEERIQRTRAAIADGGEASFLSELDRLEALVAAGRGDTKTAAEKLEESIAHADKIGARSYLRRSLLARARLDHDPERRAAAREQLRDLHASFEEGHETADHREVEAFLS